ncbi:hypothetical protein EXIGLDRAFT_766382 [Exidia glandulosa HHB12029]|uniref:Uncharacterized protein n=1 Tax=Exidia glandulosa HHB12029 TaxID=1314781 RepID=A0A165JRZ8_EXIGL|nr:hypothetical protein EXIGLDRAFT_766382 [Exidia glandulosa HHB12029]
MRTFSFLLFAASAFAASCYSGGGCNNCENRDSLYAARSAWCGSDKWSYSNSGGWGNAQVSVNGHFDSPDACWNGFADIIDQCAGHKNGGTYNWFVYYMS